MSSTLLRSKAGGIITEYDGRKVERVSDLPRAVAGTARRPRRTVRAAST